MRPLAHYDFDTGFVETLRALSPDTPDFSEYDLGFILQRRNDAGTQTWVAVTEEGKVVGTYSLLVELKFIHGGCWAGRVEDVAVRDGYRGSGIGRMLVGHAVQQAQNYNCYKVTLNCSPEISVFYEKMGFNRHERFFRLDLKSPAD